MISDKEVFTIVRSIEERRLREEVLRFLFEEKAFVDGGNTTEIEEFIRIFGEKIKKLKRYKGDRVEATRNFLEDLMKRNLIECQDWEGYFVDNPHDDKVEYVVLSEKGKKKVKKQLKCWELIDEKEYGKIVDYVKEKKYEGVKQEDIAKLIGRGYHLKEILEMKKEEVLELIKGKREIKHNLNRLVETLKRFNFSSD
jgi:hypothetical protein